MRVPANVLSKLPDMPQVRHGLELEGMGLVQDGAGHLKGPFPAGSGLRSTSSVTGVCLRVTPPPQLALRRPAPVVAYTPLWLKGTQCPTQWSSGPEMEHKD